MPKFRVVRTLVDTTEIEAESYIAATLLTLEVEKNPANYNWSAATVVEYDTAWDAEEEDYQCLTISPPSAT